jgi:hypothetical protein
MHDPDDPARWDAARPPLAVPESAEPPAGEGADDPLIVWFLSLTPTERVRSRRTSSTARGSSGMDFAPRFLEMLRVLAQHQVDLILVGGLAAIVDAPEGG